jgi:putative ABC transport system permease protein
MRMARSVRLSVAAIRSQRVRAGLALAGIAVSVGAVLVTSAIGAGAEREIVGRIEAMGTNLVIVRPAQVKRFTARAAIKGQTTSLRPDDAGAIAALEAVTGTAAAAETSAKVKAGTVTTVATVRGTSPAYAAIRRLRLQSGRFYDALDDAGGQRVAVLGARVAATLFPGRDPVGAGIRVRGVPFDVIGVLPARGVLVDGSDEDGQVLVPLQTAMRRLFNVTWLSGIFVGVARPEEMVRTTGAIRALLTERHRRRSQQSGDDFEVQDSSRYLAMQKTTADGLTRLSAGLGGLALLVGGAGILALMFLSVKERTVEIGLRVAVGARPRDVFAQFVLEAILLALGGWAVGLVVAAIASSAIAAGTTWPVAVPADALAASLAMAVVVGTAAGAVPARAASRVPPIVALGLR